MKLDQIQLDPSKPGTRVLSSTLSGQLTLSDVDFAGGVTLLQLSELNLNSVLVVSSGVSGQYQSIQEALDAVPATASRNNPYMIWITPGVYTENLNVVRDGVVLWGPGALVRSALDATPDAPGATATLTLQAAQGTSPRLFKAYDLSIRNSHSNRACVSVVGGALSTVGLDEILFQGCQFEAPNGSATIQATSMNNMRLISCSTPEEHSTAIMQISQCASLRVLGSAVPVLDLRYDAGVGGPSLAHKGYTFEGCQIGAGTALTPHVDCRGAQCRIQGCGVVLDVRATALATLDIDGSYCGTVTSDHSSVSLGSSSYQTLAVANAGVIDRRMTQGRVDVDNVDHLSVTFDAPFPPGDPLYTVLVEGPSCSVQRGPAGFDLQFSGPYTGSLGWVVLR